MRKLKVAFYLQRANSKRRGIVFALTFDEWLAIWKQSRRLHLRGRRKGCYVMSRPNDCGPYAVGNVKIISHKNNRLQSKSLFGGPERMAIGGKANLGRIRPYLAALNRSRTGKPLSKKHRQNIAAGLRRRGQQCP